MNPFNHLAKIFPEPASLFKPVSSRLEETLEQGLVVLDTNVLLLPYKIDKNNLVDIIACYKKLIAENRLYIPDHVAREFAKNRTPRLGDMFRSVDQMKTTRVNIKKYPMLSEMQEYQDLIEIQKKYDALGMEVNQAVEKVEAKIRDFGHNDPVQMAYSDIFSKEIFITPKLDDEGIEKDFKRRLEQKIPPGYKDGGKSNNAEGDVLVWHSILALGESKKNNLVFISHDNKPDWQTNVGKSPFQTRYELVNEYSLISGGRSFHIAPLSQLLESLDAKEDTLNRVIQLESSRLVQAFDANEKIDTSDSEVEEMKTWFLSSYEPPDRNLPYQSREGGYIFIWGGPYNLEDVLKEKFEYQKSPADLERCIGEIEQEYGNIDWSPIPEANSLYVTVNADYETSERAGAGDTFQVIDIEDENGNDFTKFIDQGQHFCSLSEVLNSLSNTLKIEVNGDFS